MFLLDTNVVSELRRLRPDPKVEAWVKNARDDELHLSAVTLGEIQAGIELTRMQDPAKARDLETWVDLLAGSWNIIPMDDVCFRRWAKLMHKRSDTVYEDAMIAATALVHGLTVVTRNTRHFQPFSVTLLDPFNS